MTEVGFLDDIRLGLVVMKNEFIKNFRGKKLYVFAIIIGLILGAITGVLLFLADNGLGDDADSLALTYVSLINLLIILGATLFAASAVVSEFEDRTALILFTRPINKGSIYFGKMLAAFILLSVFIAVYYLVVAALCLIGPGEVDGDLFVSLGYAICYTFACTGVAMMFSSLMKKSSTASILTFFALALLFDLVIGIIVMAAKLDDPWYLLNNAADAIVSCFGSVDIITGETVTVDAVKSVGTMIAWGAVPAAAGFLMFRRRDF